MSDNSTEISLEQMILRLQEIQKILESNSVDLTKSLELYQESINLKEKIEEKLQEIKNKITKIQNPEM